MRGYVMVGSSNLKESKSFYDAVLAVIGIVSIYEDEVCVGLHKPHPHKLRLFQLLQGQRRRMI